MTVFHRCLRNEGIHSALKRGSFFKTIQRRNISEQLIEASSDQVTAQKKYPISLISKLLETSNDRLQLEHGFSLKLCQNAFQTIPDIWFVDTKNAKLFDMLANVQASCDLQRMVLFRLKLCQDAFQTIPNISVFDTEKRAGEDYGL